MTAEAHTRGWEVVAEFEDGIQIIRDPQATAGCSLAIAVENCEYYWISDDELPEFVATLAAAGNVTVTLNKSAPVPTSGSFNEQLLQVAINNDRRVAFKYAKGQGAIIESRQLDPVKLDDVKGHKIVTGFDPDRDEIRAYRLDRIQGTVSI